MTYQEFVDHFKKEYNIKILDIACNFKSIIQMFMPSKTKKLPLKIKDIYKNANGLKKAQNHLWLKISGVIDNVNVVMPKIKYLKYEYYIKFINCYLFLINTKA